MFTDTTMLDVKPFGAIVEYVLKPILDDMRVVLELMEANKVPAKDLTKLAWKLFIFDKLMTFLTTLIVTGAICWTLYYYLLHSQIVSR